MTTTPPQTGAQPPPGPPVDQGPRVTRDEVRDLGRVRRTVGPDRKLAGVAGGLARHLDIDPVLLRVAFVVLVFFGGAGLLLYVACWLLLPADDQPRAAVHLDDRNRTYALIAVGILSLMALLADSVGQWGFPWPLVGVAVVALVVLTVLDRDRRPGPTAPPVPHAPDPVTGAFVPVPPGMPVAPVAPVAPYPGPPLTPPAAYRPVPRNPRRRGPVLFWFTLALAALGIGVLATVDLAGAQVPGSAYPAVVVGACGVMLLVGAFYGRAGGLILVGLLASVAVLAATAAQRVDGGDIRRTPVTAAAVPAELETGAGEIVLDLTQVQDLTNLDGRLVSLRSDVGRVEVIVPDGLSVDVDAKIDGPGHLVLFEDERGGVGVNDRVQHDGGTGSPELELRVRVSVGEIEIHEEGQ